MLVILRENLENLGRIGDVVRVSDGYARNYLLPRNLVITAVESNLREMEHQKRLLEKKRQAQKMTFEEMAQRLKDFSCTIHRKVSDQEKIFGSVSVTDIMEVLHQKGFQVEKKWILLESPLKALGVYPVTLQLDPDVSVTIKVWVIKEGS